MKTCQTHSEWTKPQSPRLEVRKEETKPKENIEAPKPKNTLEETKIVETKQVSISSRI
jgi:hypothetical protein